MWSGAARRPSLTPVLGVLAAVLGGLGGAVQARVNGGLGGHLHDGLAAALISNGSALLLVASAGFSRTAREGLRRVLGALRTGTLRPWEGVGGACGALYVASQGISAGPLGVAVFTVAVVCGQSGGALGVDRAGLAPGGRRPVTLTRALGAALSVVAVTVAMSGRLRGGTALGLAALPLVAGVALAFQGAVNGRVRRAAGAVVPAVFVNALVGTAALAVAFAGSVVLRGWPTGALPHEPWWYVGGAIGLGFTAIGVAVVERIGVLLLGLGVIAGQLAGAVTLDLVAGRTDPAALLGALLTLVAVTVALISGNFSRPARDYQPRKSVEQSEG